MARAGSITPGLELPERYRVIRHIARGGMASVWEAEDGLLGRRVAVKVLAEHLAEDVTAGERFQREARAAARVSNHPNVVTIYDVGEHDGRTFIVMELYTGGTVAQRLKERRPDPGVALEWLEQAAAAIDAAHEAGLVHRDIKPGNLLIDERERLGVADFGIARLAHDQTVTHSGQVLGTASYLSPEQARGEPASAASDRYSLAVVAYELLTGRRPFLEKHFAAQAQQHIEAIPPPASEVRRELPPGVDAALGRGLSKVPGRRWHTASAMVASLQRALPAKSLRETEATRAMPPPTRTARRSVAIGAGAAAAGPRSDTGSTGDAGPPTSVGVPPAAAFPPRRRPSRRILAVAAALAALVVLVAGIASGASSSGEGKVLTARVDHDTLKRAQDAADGRASARRTKRAQKQDAAQPQQATAAGAAGGQPASSSSDSGSTSAGSGDTAALNQQGFDLLNAGKVNEAIPVLQKAVDGCGSDPSNLTCAYAMFNLAKALRLAGRTQEAVALLEKRLQNPDQRAVVERELDAARGGSAPGGAPAPGGKPSKPGKAKGHRKPGKGGGDNGG